MAEWGVTGTTWEVVLSKDQSRGSPTKAFCHLPTAGWHHRISSDMVHWQVASASEPVGPNDWPSGFAVTDDDDDAATAQGGRICAGMRCDKCTPHPGAKPLCTTLRSAGLQSFAPHFIIEG